VRRLFALLVLLLVSACAASCGSSGAKSITVEKARRYELVDFRPAGSIEPGKPTNVAFTIDKPAGGALTTYRTGSGPHTGVHLIIVKDDLSTIIHRHPPVRADGRFMQSVTFPSAGRYRVIVDAYVKSGVLPNFQLFRDVTVAGAAHDRPLGGYRRATTVDGFHVVAPRKPTLRAIQAAFLKFRVTDAAGKPARFVPWYGALAHAIFFRVGTLDYFHTHVCSPGATGCASILNGSRIAGKSSAPGNLTVGVLLPTAGTWKLFLQMRPDGKFVTAPYVLKVK
jgi:hypothetical protein